jgi:hypothetical protein
MSIQRAVAGTFTEAGIVAARTDSRGECTCEFTPVGPGIYVLPVIDPHCPVHNEERAGLCWRRAGL